MDNPFPKLNGFGPANSNQEPPGWREIETLSTQGLEKNQEPQASWEEADLYVTCQKGKLDKSQNEASNLESKLSTG